MRSIMERCHVNAKRRFKRMSELKQHQMEDGADAYHGQNTFEDAWKTFKGQLEHQHTDWLRRLNEEEERVASLPRQQPDQHPASIGIHEEDGEDVMSEDGDVCDDQDAEYHGASSDGTHEDDERLSEIMQIIRVEELYWMAQEEERMEQYLASIDARSNQQMPPQASVAASQGKSTVTAHAPATLPTLPSGDAYGDDDSGDNALRWLMEPRTLALMESDTERLFEFSVVPLSSLLLVDQSSFLSPGYAFKWSGEEGEKLAGFVAIQDIWECSQSERNPNALIISITFKNPQALCNSGGLSVIVVRTESPEQAAQYCQSITSLMKGTEA